MSSLFVVIALSVLLVTLVVTGMVAFQVVTGAKDAQEHTAVGILFTISCIILMGVSLFSMRRNGWFILVPWFTIMALLFVAVMLNHGDFHSHIKEDLINYELSQGRNPEIIKESRSSFEIESGDRRITVRLWGDPVPVQLENYDSSTYFYGLAFTRDMYVIGPETIKKYGGDLPCPTSVTMKGEVKEEKIPWKPKSSFEGVIAILAMSPGGTLMIGFVTLALTGAVCLIIKNLIQWLSAIT